MNKTVIFGIVGVIVLGVVVITAVNYLFKPEAAIAPDLNQNSISRPAVQPIPNTFSIMTPEEKAASEEAARLAAEAALQASSTGTSTDDELDAELQVDEETN